MLHGRLRNQRDRVCQVKLKDLHFKQFKTHCNFYLRWNADMDQWFRSCAENATIHCNLFSVPKTIHDSKISTSVLINFKNFKYGKMLNINIAVINNAFYNLIF